MKTYEVTTTETLTRTFRIEALSDEEAWKIAETDIYAQGYVDRIKTMKTEVNEIGVNFRVNPYARK